MSRPKGKRETIQRLKIIYDSFDQKDLSWDQFRNQMLDLLDPKKAMSDLGDIELKKARERMSKMRVDRAVSRRR